MIQMGVLNASKNQFVLVGDYGNVQDKGNKKGKDNKNVDSESKEKHIPFDGASSSKKDKNKKFEKSNCSYYIRIFHPER